MITILYAHPIPKHSRVNRAMIAAVHNLPQVQVRNLYELYPDFDIDIKTEQEQLLKSHTIVLQHPLTWFHMTALLTLWMERVLRFGWAYGHDAQGKATYALSGKRLLWASTLGWNETTYGAQRLPSMGTMELSTSLQKIALFCEMNWLEPYLVRNTGQLNELALLQAAEAYRDRLVAEISYLQTASSVKS